MHAGEDTRKTDAAFAILLALLSTCVAYRFGYGNQAEQIPMVLRQLDSSYLTNDFFVSTSADFGPRFYFAWLVALMSQVLPLPWTYAALTFLSDLGLVVATMWAARRVVGAGRLGSAIAAVLTMTVSSFHLGDATEIRYEVLQPASLAIPGMLLALAFGWQGRAVPAAISATLASLAHPLYGVQGGAIAIATAFIATLIPAEEPGHHHGMRRWAWRRAIVPSVIATAILGAGALVFWWLPLQESQAEPLSTAELFDVIARFRSPHHYFPSQFRLQDYVTTAFFCAAMWMAFARWSQAATRQSARAFLVPACLVAVGCVAGTLFTELWPLRSVLTLQPFRLLSIVKWSGYLLIGWLFEQYWTKAPNPLARPVVVMGLLSAAGTFPLVLSAGLALVRFQERLQRRIDTRLVLVVLAAGALGLWLVFGSIDERVRLTVATAALVLLLHSSRRVRIAGAVAVLVLVAVVVRNRPKPFEAGSPLQMVFSPDDLQDAEALMARTIARHTPADALLVVPPNFGVLRFVGQRALVVDFKAIPLVDGPMREWRKRIREVYGDVQGGGAVASRNLENAYRAITDARLRDLAGRFGATHAVLFAETPTGLRQLAADDTYRLVVLQETQGR